MGGQSAARECGRGVLGGKSFAQDLETPEPARVGKSAGLIPEILELERHGKFVSANGGNHRLQIVPALAGDADLVVLDLRGDLELGVANEGGDLLGDLRLDALLELDDLTCVAERR